MLEAVSRPSERRYLAAADGVGRAALSCWVRMSRYMASETRREMVLATGPASKDLLLALGTRRTISDRDVNSGLDGRGCVQQEGGRVKGQVRPKWAKQSPCRRGLH